MTTFHKLIDDVHEAATNLGMDLAPSDVGFIVSAFLEGVIADPNPMPAPFTRFLQTMADEAASVKDED
jgi:hypothetical protein